MATTFSFRDGASLPAGFGPSLAERLAALFRRGEAAPVADGFAGPSFRDLEPALAGELARR